MKIVTIANGREIKGDDADRCRLEASISLKVSRILEDRERERHRPVDTPDRVSVKRIMAAVEGRIVEAVWTLARLPDRNFFGNGRCGLDYVHDRNDRFALAVGNGGKWDVSAPRPPLPTAKAIDAMYEPLEWLVLLPVEQAKIVSTAASTKRGDVARNVGWARVRAALPQVGGQTIRTLQRRYEDGLRVIAGHLC